MALNEEQRAELEEIAAKATEEALAKDRDVNRAVREAIADAMAGFEKANESDEETKALLKAQQKQGEQISQILKVMEDLPLSEKGGWLTDDGGTADPQNKSFGDFLLAVKRGDGKRLRNIYRSRKEEEVFAATKDVQLEDGPAGGYLVPEEFVAQLMKVEGYEATLRPRCKIQPVATSSGRIPALNQTTAPTAGSGDTSFAGGVTLEWTAPGGTLTETQPTFEQIEFYIRKLAGFVEVENEVLSDSAFAIEQMLVDNFGLAIRGKEEHAILRGDGVTEPLGILNSGVAVAITPATDNAFAYADALNMQARFRRVGGQPVWLIHPGVWPDIGVFEVSSGSGGVFISNLPGDLPNRLLGKPILESEHLPQDDNSGNVILADLRGYVIFDRMNSMSVAFSEHAAFTRDVGTWRVTKRLDGQPWLSAAITLADPQGSYTVSPFVYHND